MRQFRVPLTDGTFMSAKAYTQAEADARVRKNLHRWRSNPLVMSEANFPRDIDALPLREAA